MLRLLVDDKVESNVYFRDRKDKRLITRIKGSCTSGQFNIEFLGVDEDGKEIYQGDKDSWKNFIKYLYDLYKKYFDVTVDDNNFGKPESVFFFDSPESINKNNRKGKKVSMEKMDNSVLAEEYNKTCEEILNQINKNSESLEEIKSELYKLSNKPDCNSIINSTKRDIRTITLDAPDYDVMKAKAEAFDKIIEIACHDGVKFNQSWDKQEIRKNVKGGSVKVGEITGKWHGEIKFTGDEGQKDFGRFVKAMIDGLDEVQKRKFGVEE